MNWQHFTILISVYLLSCSNGKNDELGGSGYAQAETENNKNNQIVASDEIVTTSTLPQLTEDERRRIALQEECKNPVEEEGVTFELVTYSDIYDLVVEYCGITAVDGSAVFGRILERTLICNLAGFEKSTDYEERSFSSPATSQIIKIENSALDGATLLQSGSLSSNVATEDNRFLFNLTCSGKLKEQCTYKKEYELLDCSEL